MEKTEALSVIDCHEDATADEITDEFEFILFQLKKKFFERFPPIKIIQSIIKKLERLAEVQNVLQIKTLATTITPIDLNFNNLKLINFLQHYQTQTSNVKLNISNAYTPNEFIVQLKYLIDLQSLLYFKLIDVAQYQPSKDELNTIKLSEPIEDYKLKQELLFLKKEDNKLSEYISDIKPTFFYKSVLIAHKQIDYNGLRREI